MFLYFKKKWRNNQSCRTFFKKNIFDYDSFSFFLFESLWVCNAHVPIWFYCVNAVQVELITWVRLSQDSHNTLPDFFFFFIPLEQNWCNSVRFVRLLVQRYFFQFISALTMGFKSGLCNDHSKTFTLLSLFHLCYNIGGILTIIGFLLEDPVMTRC